MARQGIKHGFDIFGLYTILTGFMTLKNSSMSFKCVKPQHDIQTKIIPNLLALVMQANKFNKVT